MQNSLDISIIIITWNCKELLIKCLDSIYEKIKGIRFDIIIIDNNSIDGTVHLIEKDYSGIHLIRNDTNRGVARARNQGLRRASGRYILILDADTEIISSNFSELITFMDRNKEVGILGCAMLTGDDRPYISARTLPAPSHILLRRLAYYGFLKGSKQLKEHHMELEGINRPMRVGYVIGAFQLIRKEYMARVGPLDEKMFYGYEDADYCARMKKAGFDVVYYPHFTIKHYVQGVTRRKPFSRLMIEHTKSYVKFYIKHHDIIGKEEVGEYV